ncbi:hypothetical protein BH708_02340 [Brachybacterium sp. P6-10-X1]|uniref:hypothetical protein n=1 Tax=Brachybacterium sp. P6-10-X1 TaxID=1903186 RepID=UPI00097195E8|nr:hypothetical protein [Brachybacterium sp. P6-10-X1]APX31747.1 hypothetical protein BH708_02340 [Brachybacterium sp. P6-10-X1]
MSEQTLTEADIDATEESLAETEQDTSVDAEQEATEPGPEAAPAKRRPSGRSRTTGKAGKASVRRIADKAEQISQADEDTRALAAGLAGARSAGIADLTTAVMESKRSPVDAAIADLSGVQSGSVPEATVHLVGMSRGELQALVDLVGALSDVDLPTRVPAKSTEAAVALVEPIRAAQIDQAALGQLQELLAK